MSPSSLPNSARRFDQAALVMLMEPSMVVAASRAVVPAMPCSRCTISMACTMSPKFSIDISAVSRTLVA